ncbi:phosphoribosylformylglycinamidine synthase I [Candidatus Peregrinibacteria bacterium]|nr:MAG: phosphoribosylformylglycinamidine synthase I [Candidatus Peregrinibacteria bacterium]
MKPRVAVLQFPGINSEYETLRALWDAQIDAEFFRWNEDAKKLASYDGFVVPGGFSYEDRGRSGLIASMDPVMQEIARQADSGKPVLGICNGAQILVETGLVPGGKVSPDGRHPLLMSLARNKRVQNGKVIGVGFYNTNVFVKSVAPQGRTAFTLDSAPDELSLVPIAHGEGRFTTNLPGLFETLRANQQIVFKYASKSGEIGNEFPLNPNGAMDSAAAICNPQGNVMAIMPHPERAPSAPMPKIFSSMCKYMQARAEGKNPLIGGLPALELADQKPALEMHTHTPGTLEFFIGLLITDNEAQTVENALRQSGFDVTVRKYTYYEIGTQGQDPDKLAAELIASGELLNLNKERVLTVKDGQSFPKKEGASYYLVQDLEDAAGMAKGARLNLPVKRGWFWELTPDAGAPLDEAALLATNIFANHHAQVLQSA